MTTSNGYARNVFEQGDGVNPYHRFPYRKDPKGAETELAEEWQHPDLLALAVFLTHPGLNPSVEDAGESSGTTTEAAADITVTISPPEPAPLPDPIFTAQEILDLALDSRC